MADLDYSQTVQPEELPGRAYPRLPESAEPAAQPFAVGRGLENAGEEISQHVNAVVNQTRDTQIMEAHTKALQLSHALTHDPNSGFFTLEGKNAIGQAPQYVGKYDAQASKILASVPDPVARQHAALALTQVRGQLSEQLDTHEIEQTRRYNLETAKTSVAVQGQHAVANYNHPDIIATDIDGIDHALRSQAAQEGWAPQQLEYAQLQAHSQVHEGILDQMLADKKYDMAKAYFDTVRPELTKAGSVARIEDKIRTGHVQGLSDSVVQEYRKGTDAGDVAALRLIGPKSGLDLKEQEEAASLVERGREVWRRQKLAEPGAMDRMNNDIWLPITEHTADQGTIDKARSYYQQGLLTESELKGVYHGIDRAENARYQKLQKMQPAIDAAASGALMNPFKKDQRTAVDLSFKEQLGDAKTFSPEWFHKALRWGQNQGVVPDSAISAAVTQLGGLHSPTANPEDTVAAAHFLAQALEYDRKPGVDIKTQVIAQRMEQGLQSGASHQAIMDLGRKLNDLGAPEKTLLNAEWQRLHNPDTAYKAAMTDSASWLRTHTLASPNFSEPGVFKGFFGRNRPKIPALLLANFEAFGKQYYEAAGATGPAAVEASRQAAFKALSNVWGITHANGERELTMYPPEKIGVTPQAIRDKLTADGHPKATIVYHQGTTDNSGGHIWHIQEPGESGLLEDVLDPKTHQPIEWELPEPDAQKRAAEEEAVRSTAAGDKADAELLRHVDLLHSQHGSELHVVKR